MYLMSNSQCFRFYCHMKAILLASATVLITLPTQNILYAGENVIQDIKSSSLSWGRKYFFDSPRFNDRNVKMELDIAILEKLETYGIKLNDVNNNYKYVLNYTILLGESASEAEIDDLYEQIPDLKVHPKESANYEQGKLLISIRDRNTRHAIWKSNVEGLANLKMSNEIRQQRIKLIIDDAFATFPN